MKILVVGAGAVGGYFGGRLAEAGRDVTFLVRARRAEQLHARGLRIVSPHGNSTIDVQAILRDDLHQPYDLIFVGVKAYGLQHAIEDFAPAVGTATMILPFLNGMIHLERLAERFGRQAVLGGVCLVSTDLGEEGEIVQLTETQKLVYGELSGVVSDRVVALDEVISGGNFKTQLSHQIVRDMWEKWILLASLGGLNCLLRGSIGEIEASPGGRETGLGILRECNAIATACGFAPDESATRRTEQRFTTRGSSLTSSMYRDLTRGRPVEAEQILGDLLRRGRERGVETPLLRAAFATLAIHSAHISPLYPDS
jgi:2-dehydropantoate 2-reductase